MCSFVDGFVYLFIYLLYIYLFIGYPGCLCVYFLFAVEEKTKRFASFGLFLVCMTFLFQCVWCSVVCLSVQLHVCLSLSVVYMWTSSVAHGKVSVLSGGDPGISLRMGQGSDFELDTLVAALPDTLHYRDRTRTGWSRVSPVTGGESRWRRGGGEVGGEQV